MGRGAFAIRSGVVACALLLGAQACAKLRENPLVDTDGGPIDDDAAAATSDAAGDDGGGCTEGSPTDPKNCGRCGHDCLGGACLASVCQPVVLASSCLGPSDLTLGGSFVYWVEFGSLSLGGTDGRVMRASAACVSDGGGCAERVTGAYRPLALATSTSDLFFSNAQGEVWRVALGSVPADAGSYSADEPGVGKLATSALSLYIVRQGSGNADGTIQRQSFDQPTSTTIVPDLDSPHSVVVFQQKIVFSTRGLIGTDFDGKIWTADVTGQDATPIVDGQAQPRGVAANASHIYWANTGDGSIHRASWDGSGDVVLVTGLDNPTGIVLDSERLYWTERGVAPDYLIGRVRSAKLDGTDKLTLVDAIPAPSPIAIDAKAVYVAVRGRSTTGYNDGVVLRVAKP